MANPIVLSTVLARVIAKRATVTHRGEKRRSRSIRLSSRR
jgi:hypothetical protein